MKATKLSTPERCRQDRLEYMYSGRPLGVRQKRWTTELAAKRKQLKKLKPGSDEFNAVVGRIMKLNSCLNCRHIFELRTEITALFDSQLQVEAVELERILDEDGKRYVTINTNYCQYANGWFPEGYVSISTPLFHLTSPTADNLAGQVAEALRSEAEALTKMANMITKTAKRSGKGVAV